MSSRENRRRKRKLARENVAEVQHKASRHPIMLVLSVLVLVIIAVTFIGGPAMGGQNASGRLIFGRWGKRDIEYIPGNYFARQRDILAEQIKDSPQFADTNVEWQAYQVWQGAFNRTVIHAAILQLAEESGIVISDERVDSTLAEEGPYIRNGEFDPDLYRSTPNSDKVATRKLFREEITHQQYLEDVVVSVHSDQETAFLKDHASAQRKFRFVTLYLADFPREEVIRFGNENKSLFAKIHLRRITVREEADSLVNELRDDPDSFAETAELRSTDTYAANGGDMGWVYYYEMQSDLEATEDIDSVFQLDPGEVSEAFQASFGTVIYQCVEGAEEPDFSDQDVGKIRSYMERFERGRIEDYFVSEGNSFRATALESGFVEACAEHGFDYYDTEFFPINFGNAFYMTEVSSNDDGNVFASGASNQRFLTALFSLQEQHISEPLVLGESVIVAQFTEGREAPETELEILDFYYQYIVQQYQEEELNRMILESDKFENDFDEVFSRIFLSE